MHTVAVCLMPGQTIKALVKRHNSHSMTDEEVTEVLRLFYQQHPNVCKVGQRVEIPVLEKYLRAPK